MSAAKLANIEELAELINRWCVEHGIIPANGQSGERITERNIRYYRTRGLLDAPGEGAHKRGFSEKHAAQLRAIRLLQARPLPLEKIQEQIQGMSLDQLQELERQELRKINGASKAIMGGAALQEQWQVTLVGGEFMLVSRRGRPITEEQRRQLAVVLGVAVAGG